MAFGTEYIMRRGDGRVIGWKRGDAMDFFGKIKVYTLCGILLETNAWKMGRFCADLHSLIKVWLVVWIITLMLGG